MREHIGGYVDARDHTFGAAATRSHLRRGKARAPGTCGELVQGSIEDVHFLVTCPIDRYAVVEVGLSVEEDGGFQCPGRRDGVWPARFFLLGAGPKTLTAVVKTLAACTGRPRTPCVRGWIGVDSTLPAGKGMGSSTADISAACLATAVAFGEKLTPQDIADLALSIEPSDGVMYPGITMFAHRDGRWCYPLGDPPPMQVLMFDTGGVVDTLSFNSRSDLLELNRKKEPVIREALALVRQGLRRKDAGLIGQGATLSARANEVLLPKPDLERFISLAREIGAAGVNVAHSGTVVGILVADEGSRATEAEAYISKSGIRGFLGRARIIGGGVQKVGDGHEGTDIAGRDKGNGGRNPQCGGAGRTREG